MIVALLSYLGDLLAFRLRIAVAMPSSARKTALPATRIFALAAVTTCVTSRISSPNRLKSVASKDGTMFINTIPFLERDVPYHLRTLSLLLHPQRNGIV